MVHYTCDLCGRDLTTTGERRFVLKIAAYPGFDPDQITEDDLDADHMEEVAEILRNGDHRDDESAADGYRGFRYDLCPSCHEKFLKDPLGKDLSRAFDLSDFSQN